MGAGALDPPPPPPHPGDKASAPANISIANTGIAERVLPRLLNARARNPPNKIMLIRKAPPEPLPPNGMIMPEVEPG